jgi:XTP/dITP diphosphohydrolase
VRTLVLATHNRGKLREFRELLEPEGWRVIGLADIAIERIAPETGGSFAENARQKALSYSNETELAVLADDSGLEVVSLGGRPGIESARYAGPDASDLERIRKLLVDLERTSGSRSARFVCALAMARRGSLMAEAEGECPGEIAREPRGENGFGYDPIFQIPETGRTYAELTNQEKNRISHRARAVKALLAILNREDSPQHA